MSVLIPEEVVNATHLSEVEFVRELALLLYEKDRLTLGQASNFAKMSVPDFMELLKQRDIPPHYGVSDLMEDAETIRQLRAEQ